MIVLVAEVGTFSEITEITVLPLCPAATTGLVQERQDRWIAEESIEKRKTESCRHSVIHTTRKCHRAVILYQLLEGSPFQKCIQFAITSLPSNGKLMTS